MQRGDATENDRDGRILLVPDPHPLAERKAKGVHGNGFGQGLIIPELECCQAGIGVDLNQGQVEIVIGPHDFRREPPLRIQPDIDHQPNDTVSFNGFVDHVGIGDEQTGFIDAERRAGGLAVRTRDIDQGGCFLAPSDYHQVGPLIDRFRFRTGGRPYVDR